MTDPEQHQHGAGHPHDKHDALDLPDPREREDDPEQAEDGTADGGEEG